jgi:hypothetical protein
LPVFLLTLIAALPAFKAQLKARKYGRPLIRLLVRAFNLPSSPQELCCKRMPNFPASLPCRGKPVVDQ